MPVEWSFARSAEQGVGVEREGGHFGGAAGGRWLLPGFIAAESKDVRKGKRRDDEVGGFAAGASRRTEKIEGNRTAVEDEPGEQAAGLVGVGKGRSGIGRAEDGFDEGGRRRGKLGCAWGEEDQAGGVEPVAEHVDGEDGIGVVMPMGEAGGGELVSRGSA